MRIDEALSAPTWATIYNITGRSLDSAGASNPALKLDSVSVRFGGLTALDDVSFTVDKGEIVAVIGPNGAGKTSTLNAIFGLVPRTGLIEFCGRPLGGAERTKLAALGLGRSFQDPVLIDGYTALENVMCGAHVQLQYGAIEQVVRRRKVRKQESHMRHRALAILEIMNLGPDSMRLAGSLPYGARKLIDIARALISQPTLLLLDEPSSGLDGGERNALGNLIKTLNVETGVSVVAVEHHMDFVSEVAHKVVALQAGSVLVVGRPDDVLKSSEFKAAVVGTPVKDEPRHNLQAQSEVQ